MPKTFPFNFYQFKNALKPQKWSVFSRKKVKPLHKYCVLLQLKRCLVPNLYLTLNCEIVFFERYHISVFFATELPYISVWRANGPFQILKSSANIKSRGLEEIKLWKKMKLCFLRQSWIKCCRQIYKIKPNRFFHETFTADFLQFFTEKRQNLAFGWTARYLPLNHSLSETILRFPKS